MGGSNRFSANPSQTGHEIERLEEVSFADVSRFFRRRETYYGNNVRIFSMNGFTSKKKSF